MRPEVGEHSLNKLILVFAGNSGQQEDDAVCDVFELANTLVLIEKQILLDQTGVEAQLVLRVLDDAADLKTFV